MVDQVLKGGDWWCSTSLSIVISDARSAAPVVFVNLQKTPSLRVSGSVSRSKKTGDRSTLRVLLKI